MRTITRLLGIREGEHIYGWRNWIVSMIRYRHPWGKYGIPLPVWSLYRYWWVPRRHRRIARAATEIRATECRDCGRIVAEDDRRWLAESEEVGRWLCVDCWENEP